MNHLSLDQLMHLLTDPNKIDLWQRAEIEILKRHSFSQSEWEEAMQYLKLEEKKCVLGDIFDSLLHISINTLNIHGNLSALICATDDLGLLVPMDCFLIPINLIDKLSDSAKDRMRRCIKYKMDWFDCLMHIGKRRKYLSLLG